MLSRVSLPDLIKSISWPFELGYKNHIINDHNLEIICGDTSSNHYIDFNDKIDMLKQSHDFDLLLNNNFCNKVFSFEGKYIEIDLKSLKIGGTFTSVGSKRLNSTINIKMKYKTINFPENSYLELVLPELLAEIVSFLNIYDFNDLIYSMQVHYDYFNSVQSKYFWKYLFMIKYPLIFNKIRNSNKLFTYEELETNNFYMNLHKDISNIEIHDAFEIISSNLIGDWAKIKYSLSYLSYPLLRLLIINLSKFDASDSTDIFELLNSLKTITKKERCIISNYIIDNCNKIPDKYVDYILDIFEK